MTEYPHVCITIPVYNGDHTLERTLNSLLQTTYPNFSIIVMDNASTDHTADIVSAFRDPRLSIITAKENTSGEQNFNRCIAVSDSPYTAIYHADDLYEPTMLFEQVKILESNPDISAVFVRAKIINDQDQVVRESPSFKALGLPETKFATVSQLELFTKILHFYNFLFCPSVVARTEILQQKTKGWEEEKFKTSSDLNLWLNLAAHSKIAIINQPLFKYRVGSHHFSSMYRVTRTDEAHFFLVVDHWLNHSPLRANVSPADIQRYEVLRSRDLLIRSINARRMGEHQSSLDLLKQARKGLTLCAIKTMKDLQYYGACQIWSLMNTLNLSDKLIKKFI